MQTGTWIAAGLLALFANAALAETPAGTWDGLVEVKARRFDEAYLAAGADFRPYSKVIVDPTQVAFRKNWLQDINEERSVTRRVTEEDAQEILAAARRNFDDIFVEAFTRAGYTVVTTPGSDVLRVTTGIVNLHLNAPDTMNSTPTRTYTRDAGEATLVIEMHDSLTGAPLGRVLDRRDTIDWGFVRLSNRVTNTSDFRNLFKTWSSIAVQELASLKEISPLPDPLSPGQKLGN